MVFSNVGEAGSAAMRSISPRFTAIAASSAGFRSAGLNRPNGGTPPHGPDQGSSSGFTWAAAPFPAEREAASSGFAGCVAQPHKAAKTAASGAAVLGAEEEVIVHPWRRLPKRI